MQNCLPKTREGHSVLFCCLRPGSSEKVLLYCTQGQPQGYTTCTVTKGLTPERPYRCCLEMFNFEQRTLHFHFAPWVLQIMWLILTAYSPWLMLPLPILVSEESPYMRSCLCWWHTAFTLINHILSASSTN